MADHELIETLRRLRYDLTAMQVKVSEALRMAGSLNLDAIEWQVVCRCGLKFGSAFRLAEHVYTSHDGPVPAHWVSGESLAKEEAPEIREHGSRSRLHRTDGAHHIYTASIIDQKLYVDRDLVGDLDRAKPFVFRWQRFAS